MLHMSMFKKIVIKHDVGMGEAYMDGDYLVDDLGVSDLGVVWGGLVGWPQEACVQCVLTCQSRPIRLNVLTCRSHPFRLIVLTCRSHPIWLNVCLLWLIGCTSGDTLKLVTPTWHFPDPKQADKLSGDLQ